MKLNKALSILMMTTLPSAFAWSFPSVHVSPHFSAPHVTPHVSPRVVVTPRPAPAPHFSEPPVSRPPIHEEPARLGPPPAPVVILPTPRVYHTYRNDCDDKAKKKDKDCKK